MEYQDIYDAVEEAALEGNIKRLDEIFGEGCVGVDHLTSQQRFYLVNLLEDCAGIWEKE